MIELFQFPWSPYCLVQQRILEFGGIRHKIVNVPATDRSLVWRLTRQRYYQVPVIRDGRVVVFETEADSQVVAKYLEGTFQIGLFPAAWEGVQRILWACVENEIEDLTFRLNDAYFREFVPAREQLQYRRFKERKFGRGCLELWLQTQKQLLARLNERLEPFEQMLTVRPFLLGERPLFLDFDLWGMLANFLFSGHYQIAAALPRLKRWYQRMGQIKLAEVSREKKLHS